MDRLRFSYADLSIAYRKAKSEAFYENTHFNALAFSEYEQNLQENLKRLRDSLNEGRWFRHARSLGGFAYAPKSLGGFKPDNGDIYFRSLDPIEEWRRQWILNRRRKITAKFRLIIKPTIDFHVISALWVLKVGHKYDSCLDGEVAYANRLRRYAYDRSFGEISGPIPPNQDCLGLFKPYFDAYRRWREDGLSAMRGSLRDGRSILAVTMDLASFYHRVSPEFLLHKRFLRTIGVRLEDEDFVFTRQLISALKVWYRETPDYRLRAAGALPVGLSLLAGLEYVHTPKGLRNDAFVSLTTDWAWYPTNIVYLQPKFSPSHEEKRSLWKHGRKRLYTPRDFERSVPTYVHRDFCFSVLLCSDLTNIRHREGCQGKVDALFVLEWNKDTDSFSTLVESAAHDLHAYIVQVNNREYGDSRIRAPRRKHYLRDVVRVRGGEQDYFVVAKLEVDDLRRYQRRPVDNGPFKPLPIGYEMSDRRRLGA